MCCFLAIKVNVVDIHSSTNKCELLYTVWHYSSFVRIILYILILAHHIYAIKEKRKAEGPSVLRPSNLQSSSKLCMSINVIYTLVADFKYEL